MTLSEPGALAAPGRPIGAAPLPVPRPPLPRAAAHRARLAGGVGGGLAWIGLAIAQACAALLGLGLAIPALLLGAVAWMEGAPDPGAGIARAVLPWLGTPTAIALAIGVPLGLGIALLGLWLSARMLRHPGLAHPVGVTWAAFGIALVAASIVNGLGSSVASPFVGGVPGIGAGGLGGPSSGIDPDALAEWADADRLLAIAWPFVAIGSLASIIVPIVLSVFAWWWMAHAMRPAAPPPARPPTEP